MLNTKNTTLLPFDAFRIEINHKHVHMYIVFFE